MSAIINYAEAYQQGLQQRYAANGLLYTQKLWNSPSNNLLKFNGAKTVRVPKLLIKNGRKDRTRRSITTVEANYENQWETYELSNERYWSTLVDPSDVDETQQVTSIANITKVYNDEEKVPEMDKQMNSTLFARKNSIATGEGIEQINLDETNFLATFDKLMTDMDEKGVPSVGRTIFCTPQVRKIIKNLQQFSRTVPVQNNSGEINRIISRIDDVTIEPAIPSDRMKTLYDFTTGAVADATAKQIHFFLIYIPCMAAPQKYSFVGLDAPSAANSGNWLYYEQSYDDVLLFETKHEGLAFVIEQ
ncbi:MAG: capsid protein [Streptococcaceae bacterium]|jgi:hypothetical protein|nr:capsid protein [Streptococcaceae bacterium]MCH4176195.1 capsid protein [Streptococcaceae bacterium]